MSFRGENANALLIVSSDPKLVEDFVNLKERTAKSKAAKEAVDEIRKSLKKITWEIKKPEEEQNADVITELFNNIGEKLALLMSGQDWGAEDDPVLLNYPKPRLSVYAAIYLGPHAAEYVSQTTLQNTFSDPNAKNKSAKKLFGNAVTEKAWKRWQDEFDDMLRLRSSSSLIRKTNLELMLISRYKSDCVSSIRRQRPKEDANLIVF